MRKGMFILMLTFLLILSSCSLESLFMSDSQVVNVQFDKLLETIQSKDKEALKSLFSKQAILDAQTIDSNIELLFDYFQGDNATYEDDGGLVVDEANENGVRTKIIKKTYDVDTSVETYRFAICVVLADSINPDNVGIWSVYVIRMKDDTNPVYAYWGDNQYSPGINIGIRNMIR